MHYAFRPASTCHVYFRDWIGGTGAGIFAGIVIGLVASAAMLIVKVLFDYYVFFSRDWQSLIKIWILFLTQYLLVGLLIMLKVKKGISQNPPVFTPPWITFYSGLIKSTVLTSNLSQYAIPLA